MPSKYKEFYDAVANEVEALRDLRADQPSKTIAAISDQAQAALKREKFDDE